MFMQTNETISQFLQGFISKMEGGRCRNENSGWGVVRGRVMMQFGAQSVVPGNDGATRGGDGEILGLYWGKILRRWPFIMHW